MEKLKDIMRKLIGMETELGLEFSPDAKLECARAIFITEYIQESRGGTVKAQGQQLPPKGAVPGSTMASDKQIGFLKKLGYNGETNGLSMADASALIKGLKGE